MQISVNFGEPQAYITPFCKSCFVDFEFYDILLYHCARSSIILQGFMLWGLTRKETFNISTTDLDEYFPPCFRRRRQWEFKSFRIGLISNLQILRLQKTLIYITVIMLRFLGLFTCVYFHFCKRSRTFLLTSATLCRRRIFLEKVLDFHENTTSGICLHPKDVPRTEK
jgi:hypothetical protein